MKNSNLFHTVLRHANNKFFMYKMHYNLCTLLNWFFAEPEKFEIVIHKFSRTLYEACINQININAHKPVLQYATVVCLNGIKWHFSSPSILHQKNEINHNKILKEKERKQKEPNFLWIWQTLKLFILINLLLTFCYVLKVMLAAKYLFGRFQN